jgi:hypothetical protein
MLTHVGDFRSVARAFALLAMRNWWFIALGNSHLGVVLYTEYLEKLAPWSDAKAVMH